MKPLVLVIGASDADCTWLQACVEDAASIVGAATKADLVESAMRASLIVIGEDLLDATLSEIGALLDHAGVTAPRLRLGDARSIDPDPAVAYVLSRDGDEATIGPLLLSMAWGRPSERARQGPVADVEEAHRRERAFALSRRLAATTTLADAELAVITATLDLVAADRARCLFFEAASGEVWSPSRASEERLVRADRGLIGWAARTGRTVRSPRAEADPRWLGAVDDPAGRGDERILIQPIIAPDHEIHAVLVAVRSAARPAFRDEDAAALRALSEFSAPLLEQLAAHVEASSFITDSPGGELFRAEAVESASARSHGDVVRITPSWMRWVYWGLVVVMVSAGALMLEARVHTYSRGPAVVRMKSRDEVTARTAGTVAEVIASAGMSVNVGDVLARLDNEAQGAEAARLAREFEARIRERLLAPTSSAVGEAVARSRLELERSHAALEERLVRAPVGGVVGDIRVRPGQRVEPGDLIASVGGAVGDVEVLAFLPGGDRPRLDRGQHIRLELRGFHGAYQDLAIDTVATEAMGPEEARRYVGGIGEGVELSGPVVLVRARAIGTFAADGTVYRYVDGMRGQVEIEIDSERLIEALVPGLRWL